MSRLTFLCLRETFIYLFLLLLLLIVAQHGYCLSATLSVYGRRKPATPAAHSVAGNLQAQLVPTKDDNNTARVQIAHPIITASEI